MLYATPREKGSPWVVSPPLFPFPPIAPPPLRHFLKSTHNTTYTLP